MSEQALSAILDSMSIPMFAIDPQHVVIHWNQACVHLTGVAAERVVGTRKAWTAFYPHERPVLAELVVDQRSRQEILAIYGDVCRESGAFPGAYEFEAFFRHFGDGKWLFCTASLLRDAAGGAAGAVETFQDITERKRVEAELQNRVDELSEAKRRLEVLVSNTTDREKRMVDLKREVNELLQALGRGPKYDVPRKVAELVAATGASAAR